MVHGAGRLNELLCPSYRLEISDKCAEERRIRHYGGGHVEVALVGGPPERGAQISELDGEPDVGVALAGTVPKEQDVCFPSGEVTGMRSPDFGRRATSGELLLGELADRFQHGKPSAFR